MWSCKYWISRSLSAKAVSPLITLLQMPGLFWHSVPMWITRVWPILRRPQINCKLYAFNKENCSWLERGRGLLRLNDRREGGGGGPLHSRLVFRTQGSLRLVLNTKVGRFRTWTNIFTNISIRNMIPAMQYHTSLVSLIRSFSGI